MPRHRPPERATKSPPGQRTCRHCRRHYRHDGPSSLDAICPACREGGAGGRQADGADARRAAFRAPAVERYRRIIESGGRLFEGAPAANGGPHP